MRNRVRLSSVVQRGSLLPVGLLALGAVVGQNVAPGLAAHSQLQPVNLNKVIAYLDNKLGIKTCDAFVNGGTSPHLFATGSVTVGVPACKDPGLSTASFLMMSSYSTHPSAIADAQSFAHNHWKYIYMGTGEFGGFVVSVGNGVDQAIRSKIVGFLVRVLGMKRF